VPRLPAVWTLRVKTQIASLANEGGGFAVLEEKRRGRDPTEEKVGTERPRQGRAQARYIILLRLGVISRW
jgi:hypothetical protein